jgi:hypothetical protein
MTRLTSANEMFGAAARSRAAQIAAQGGVVAVYLGHRLRQAGDPQLRPRAFSGTAQGPGVGWPLCTIEIATPTSEAAISTDQKMIAM